MPKCTELSHLSKAAHGLKSIKFKRTTPGSINGLAFANKPPSKQRVLDPSHPALKLSPAEFAKAFPWRSFPGFSIRAVPKGLLDKPSTPFPDPPFSFAPVHSAEQNDSRSGRGRVSMSLMNLSPQSAGGRVLRVNVLNKLKNAISLVVTRGADAEGEDGAQRVVFKQEGSGGDWVLSDWTYLCRPQPEINSMPYATLISGVRRALQAIVVRGTQLEQQWALERTLQPRPVHPLQKFLEFTDSDDDLQHAPITEPLRPQHTALPSAPLLPRMPSVPPPPIPPLPTFNQPTLQPHLSSAAEGGPPSLSAMMQRLKDGLSTHRASQPELHSPKTPTKFKYPIRARA
ncbi:hypothetical protein C8Q76DRAFT_750886 [Earliella scabrosa]|nr:hypothetical protein C8Q76DRAFT_750886 [Earliella scabrosa]